MIQRRVSAALLKLSSIADGTAARTHVVLVVVVSCDAAVTLNVYSSCGRLRSGTVTVTSQTLQSIMIFDLGGISHFTKENQFPVTWNERDTALLLNGCYLPTEWDFYWRLEPCKFVMHKIETEEKLFGTPVIPQAWARAVVRHPIAYLEHRASFMWNLLSGSNLTIWVADIEKPNETVFPDRPAFAVLMVVHDVLKPTVFFRVGFWLLACLLMLVALAWRRQHTPEGAFAIAACGSASLYVLTFFSVGVASDFRYGYWAVLASIAGFSALLSPVRPSVVASSASFCSAAVRFFI